MLALFLRSCPAAVPRPDLRATDAPRAVKGGAGVIGNRYNAFDGTGALLASADETRWGGTVGAGLEFGFAPSWSIGVEYDHTFTGSRNINLTDPTGAFFETEHISQDVDMALVRLNYRFNGSAFVSRWRVQPGSTSRRYSQSTSANG